MALTDDTIRQAALALIDRRAESRQWTSTTDVCEVLLGREPTMEDWFVGEVLPGKKPWEKNARRVGPAWQIVRVLRELQDTEQLERTGHLGWRRRTHEEVL